MKYKVFIDGSVGTTGLRIFERLENRTDIEILKIAEQDRKILEKRIEMVNKADLAFLCLPDVAAKEIADNASPAVKIIDTSTAHRTNPNWVYGFAELDFGKQAEKIKNSNRVAVPGCHATGFLSIVAPLVQMQLVNKDYPFTAHSVTGYSGGGKATITEYAENQQNELYTSPRQYALLQQHKHLPEMKYVANIDYPPIFNPIISNFYNGMVVTVPILPRLCADANLTPAMVAEKLKDFYKDQPLVTVYDENTILDNGFLSTNKLADFDNLEIFVYGHQDQIVIASRFDNLGKGASGSAIQCMNIMLGINQTQSLNISK